MGQGRKTFYAASLLLFALGVESGGFQISLMQMMEEFDLSGTYSGMMVSAQYSAIIIMPILMGRIADRADKRTILLLFGTVFLVGCVGIVSLRKYVLLVCSIFVIGSGYSVCESVLSAHLTDIYKACAGRYLTLSQCFFSIGALVGPQLVEFGRIFWGLDWRFLFVASGVCGFFSVLLLRTFRTKKESETIRRIMAKKPGKEILLLALGMFIYGSLEVGIGYYINSFVTLELHAPKRAALLLSLFWLLMIPGRVLGGMFYNCRKNGMFAGYVFAGICLLGVSMTDRLWMAGILFGLLGVAIAPLWPYFMSIAAEEYADSSATATGILSTGCGIGAVISPVFLGRCVDIGGLRMGFRMLAVLAFLGIAAAFFYFRVVDRKRTN